VPSENAKRHDDEVAAFNYANASADIFDDADRFVSHRAPGVAVFHLLIWPEITSANASASDANDRVGWFYNLWVRDVLDSNVAGFIHDRCAHDNYLLFDAETGVMSFASTLLLMVCCFRRDIIADMSADALAILRRLLCSC
jgi:hypothetical protein